MSSETFTLAITEGIATVTIDVPAASQNTIKAEFVTQLNALFDTLETESGLRGVIFHSGKTGSFIAGADIHMLAACENAAQVTELARQGQAFCNRVAGFKVPVVAAIDGVCLGGGLEFALACHARICGDSSETVLGLPEVQLGLLPGSGGTQRLPRQIGISAALDMMLTARRLRPQQAHRRGLVDAVVAKSLLLSAARQRIDELASAKPDKSRKTLSQRLLEANPLGRGIIFSQARKRLRAKTHGNYPAPERIIDSVQYGFKHGLTAGFEFEAKCFGELSQTPAARQLINLYFATTEQKKDRAVDAGVSARSVERIGVLGAGLMGAGIAYVSSARAGVSVRLKDKDETSLQDGLGHIQRQIQQRRKRRAISAYQASLQQHRITPSVDYSGFARLDLVIEAVFEDLELKQQMLRDIEAHGRDDTIFASNTSSLPIAEIASAAERPENVIGMHYFSPVEKMPLLEIIATPQTATETLATAVEFGRRQGKTVIVVQDGAGFYVNRILAPYINAAGYLLLQGVTVDAIDQALLHFGFPVGPFALLDEVGLAVGSKIAPILQQAFGDRMQAPALVEKMLADGRTGKKGGQGFYLYGGRGSGKRVDDSIYPLLDVNPNHTLVAEQIVERCLLTMLNEAARCLEEGVIGNARDGDIGAVFGIGFPPFRGGPFRYLDSLGAKTVVTKLEGYANSHGEPYQPADTLRHMAQTGNGFYD